jgi:hypothetical protein
MATDGVHKRVEFWMLVATLLLVGLQFLHEAMAHGELIQLTRDLDRRVSRIEAWIDNHAAVK